MKPRHKRLAIIGGIVAAVGVAAALVLNAFQSNLVFFYSPSQVAAKEAPLGRTFRIGGLVKEGSLKREGTAVQFAVTDTAQTIAVQYQGILQVSFKLTERESGKVVSETPLLQTTQDFGAVSGVVVTSSPNFQRGTIDSRDLVNLTNVQIGGARRRDALRGLLDLLAHDVYQRAVEGF